MTEIDWRAIRPRNGTRMGGFQELCAGLALGEKPEEAEFFTPGDPDGGVDCYAAFEGGSEWGWQAKYFLSLGDSQFSQLDDSVRTALDKHPCLARYIICMPLNLADPRVKGRTSARDKWNQHVVKWENWAKNKGMDVDFELWDGSKLVILLTQQQHAGKRSYWFNEKIFDQNWFKDRLKEAIDTAGDRYTPELSY